MGDVYRYCFNNHSATGFTDGRNGLYASRDPYSIYLVGVIIPGSIDLNRKGQGDLQAGKYLIVDYNLNKRPVDLVGRCC